MDVTYARLRALFDHCVDLPDGERESWMDANVTDANQRIELELMLAADRGQTGFLQRDVAEHIELLGDAVGPEFDPETLIGRRFGAFQLQRLIGRGGQGTVFLAERVDSDFAQTAAVKLLSRGIHDSDEHRRFRREREILARFEHAGVARLIDGGVSGDGVPYLIMEYVEGVSIEQWCEDQALDLRARVALFAQVCDVVSAAHRALIVHRDLKPSNVFVTPEGKVKVLDFGIARLLDEDETQSQTAVPIMTPGYGAPEQARGGAITLATDVHALGMLLRVLLTNTPPPMFPAELTPLPELVPPELRWVIAKACAMESDRRYRDAAELGDDIARFLGARPVLAHPPSRWYVARKFIKRHRGAVSMTAALVLMTLASLGVALWQGHEARDQARLAQQQARRAGLVRDFLMDVLQTAESDLPRGERATPENLAKAAASKLRTDTTLPDDMRLDYYWMLAKVSMSANAYAQAEQLLTDAEPFAWSEGRRGYREWLTARAEALLANDKPDAAYDLLHAQLADLQSSSTTSAAVGLHTLGLIEWQRGNFESAVAYTRQCADTYVRALGADHRVAMEAGLEIGNAYAAAGRWSEATAELKPRLQRWAQLRLPNSEHYANSLVSYGHALNQAGLIVEAAEHMEQALAVRRAVFTAPNLAIANSLSALGQLALNRGEYARSIDLRREALQMRTALLKSDDPVVIVGRVQLATSFAAAQQYDAAESELIQAQKGCANRGNAHPYCIGPARVLASIYLDQKRLDRAEAAINDAIAVTTKLHGEDSAELLQPYQILGRLRREQGREGDSLAAYDRALALAAPDSPGAIETRRLRAFALQHFKRWDAASSEIAEVIALMRVSELADSRNLMQALIVQCELADLRGDKPLASSARAALREMKQPDLALQAPWQVRYDAVLKVR